MDYPDYEGVDLDLSEHVLTIRLNRPELNNAFTPGHAIHIRTGRDPYKSSRDLCVGAISVPVPDQAVIGEPIQGVIPTIVVPASVRSVMDPGMFGSSYVLHIYTWIIVTALIHHFGDVDQGYAGVVGRQICFG